MAMSDSVRDPSVPKGGRLSDAIVAVKNAAADRGDVVVDLRDAERMRLELLAAEMSLVFSEIPPDVDFFDLAISSGLQPRLWIDCTSHVTMGRDRRTYRFVRETRLGRVVLAESPQIAPVADQVTRYIAERLVERQRMMDGPRIDEAFSIQATSPPRDPPSPRRRTAWNAWASGFLLFATGALAGLALAVLILWDKMALVR